MKKVWLVTILSLVLSGIAVLCIYLDNDGSVGRLVAFFILPIWAFCVIPSYIYEYNRLNKMSFEEGAKEGIMYGILFGFGALLIPIFLAPIYMIMYYKDVVTSNKRDKDKNL